VAVNPKSAKKIVNATDAVWSLLVPITVKLKGFAELDERPVTVATVDVPGEIEGELKMHTTLVLHLRMMEFCLTVLGPEAVIVNCAVWVPTISTCDRVLEEREKTELPVPARVRLVAPFTASEATVTAALRFPEALGVKLTETEQLWPAFRVAGVMGKLIPQLLVCAKVLEMTEMLVMVTARLPLLIRRAVWLALVVPTVCAPKVSLLGVKIKDPPERTPFPVTVMPWTPVPELSLMVI
jgi:hypothetical protein